MIKPKEALRKLKGALSLSRWFYESTKSHVLACNPSIKEIIIFHARFPRVYIGFMTAAYKAE